MRKITVHSGISVEDRCKMQMHPVREVEYAKRLIDALSHSSPIIVYSNSTDFVSAIKYIGIREKVVTDFFLDGVSHGDDIEPIFADFNRSLDLINELGETLD